ncbi:MAG: hypothetical protein CM1200mP32_08060 [Methanobacteriota archaeon]|nr:MAG: hypothetical protein CM1200mP32_08060 [Euryarchaeota archaeon]
MNLHGPYYAELLGSRRERNRTLTKMEASMQAGKIVNARHLVYHVGPYGEYEPGPRGQRAGRQISLAWSIGWARYGGRIGGGGLCPLSPWVHDAKPSLVGIETSGGRTSGAPWRRSSMSATSGRNGTISQHRPIHARGTAG